MQPSSSLYRNKRFWNPWLPKAPSLLEFLKWRMTRKPAAWPKQPPRIQPYQAAPTRSRKRIADYLCKPRFVFNPNQWREYPA